MWQKSSFSGVDGSHNCLEVAADGGTVHIREGDRPQEIVAIGPAALRDFVLGVKAGEFDQPGA
ncbi:hypothetical protein AQ490_05075 [Wenjunlia vitaminophila]|uniref:DUF397 domain-containing protein n=1 Tax=Wenjunlia vitaminophila TaxID=76728 RepID=A0A0T6LP99_WENVI|nr:hypothetical protein AQ490_05075 [Wenjunlia vitaminophila]